MDTLFDVELTPDQRSLITRIADPWLATGNWPVWASIQHHFDARHVDADELFESLPRVGVAAPFGAGYGFTTPMRTPIDPTHQVRLTIAGASRLPKGRITVGEPFVKVLRHMVQLYAGRTVTDHSDTQVHLRSAELMATMPDLRPWFVQVLPDLLSNEPAINTSGGAGFNDGGWEQGPITRSVRQFRDVQSVEDYIERTCELVTAEAVKLAPLTEAAQTPSAAEPERGPYVDPALLTDLEAAAANGKWKVHKLIALCQGLNDAYAAGNAYVCAAMIRTILDHIPPVFGHTDFKHVASQHPFGKTDKAHAQKLFAFKDVGDDVMHRQINSRVPVVTMDSVPAPLLLNAVLHELLALLQKEAATAQ